MFTTLPDMAARRAQMTPEKLAFQDDGTGRDWTFAEINSAADAIAAALRVRGLGEGDRIAILSLNRAEYFIAAFACQKSGVILCNLNWRQPVAEILDALSPLRPGLILHDAQHAAPAEHIAATLKISACALDTDVADWIAEGGPRCDAPVPADRPWYVLFTSGTTGRAKACIQTAGMAWANAINGAQGFALTGEDTGAVVTPMFHTSGFNAYASTLFLLGGTSTILPRADIDRLVAFLQAGRLSFFFAVPQVYQALSLHPAFDRIDWAGITCGCGGAPLQAALVTRFAARGAVVQNGFGMTETAPTALAMDRAHALDKIGSVGRGGLPLADFRIAGLAADAPGTGELLLRGPIITPGYLDAPEQTAAAFTKDGWFRTGDIARRDDEGFLFIVDRIKDMFISGGENVYPAEVERVLNAHPAILESAVIGVPDDRWGEVGAAYLLLQPGEDIDTDALRDGLRTRLAAYKIPARFTCVSDFPRTASGKILKPALRAQATQGG